MSTQASEWSEYIGICNLTLDTGTKPMCEIFCPEILPHEFGCPEKVDIVKACVYDPVKKCSCCSIVNLRRTLVCNFLGNTNQLIPCIHQGERVRVLNWAGTQQYYWMPMGRDPGLRRHERIRWFAMNQAKAVTGEDQYEEVRDDNTYFVEFNTNCGKKEMHIHTSNNEGECCGYDIYIRTEKGDLQIIDTFGNELFLDSPGHYWKMYNVDTTIVELDKKDIRMFCPDNMTVTANKSITVNTPKYTRNTSELDTINTPKHVANEDETILNATKRTATISDTEATTVGTENMTCSGTITAKGSSVNVDGKVTFTGSNFTVASSSGTIPVIIVFGSNAW